MITLRRHFSPILMAFFRAKFRHNTASILGRSMEKCVRPVIKWLMEFSSGVKIGVLKGFSILSNNRGLISMLRIHWSKGPIKKSSVTHYRNWLFISQNRAETFHTVIQQQRKSFQPTLKTSTRETIVWVSVQQWKSSVKFKTYFEEH